MARVVCWSCARAKRGLTRSLRQRTACATHNHLVYPAALAVDRAAEARRIRLGYRKCVRPA